MAADDNATEYLRPEDHGLMDYPDAEIMRWTIKHKEKMLEMFRRWRHQYQMEVTLDAKKQRALTKFGFIAKRPDGIDDPDNVTRTRR